MHNIDNLNMAIENKSLELVYTFLHEIKKDIDSGDVETIEYIVSPANITKLHNDLVEMLGVNRRLIQLRNRVSNTAYRASLFTQAMINGVGNLL